MLLYNIPFFCSYRANPPHATITNSHCTHISLAAEETKETSVAESSSKYGQKNHWCRTKTRLQEASENKQNSDTKKLSLGLTYVSTELSLMQ